MLLFAVILNLRFWRKGNVSRPAAYSIDCMAIQGYICQFVPADIEAVLTSATSLVPRLLLWPGSRFRATRTSQPDWHNQSDIVALKLHFDRRKNSRIQREMTAMEKLSHPNLARLIEHGDFSVASRHTRYAAWAFIEGLPLSAQLKAGPLLESEVLAIGRDVSSAIAQIWSQGIIHGDIKPSNIMLRNSAGYVMVGSVDNAVLIDLGAARYLDQDNTRTLKPSRHPEQSDRRAAVQHFGTWGYFSPEQIRRAKVLSCASDVFSLGIVLLQCLLGRHPSDYDQATLADGIQASGSKLAASAGLVEMLDKMLSPLPASRPNPAELTRRFQALLQTMQAKFAGGDSAPLKAQP